MTLMEENTELLRKVVEQNQTILDDQRAATEKAEQEDKAREAKGEQRMGENKRSMFAAMAMQGLLRADDTEASETDLAAFSKSIGRYAVAYADALIAELAQPPQEPARPTTITEAMVGRFLSWSLPKDFTPDCGIAFKPFDHPSLWPSGTNLLTSGQARAMLEHVLKTAD